MWTGAEVQRVSEFIDEHGSGRGRAISVWCWLWRRVPRTSSSRLMSACSCVCHGYRTLRAVPRNSALTTSASAFLEVDCCSVKAVSLASIRGYILVFFVCLFVWFWACMTDVFLGCVPSISDFTVYIVRWLFDWVVVLHWILCMCVCVVRDR